MKINLLLLAIALFAVVVALFAWAVPTFKKAVRRQLDLLPLMFRQPASMGGVQFANIGEGTQEHGVKTYYAGAVTTSRYLLYTIGTDGDHVALCGAAGIPLGSSDDQVDDITVPIAVKLFGAVKGTVRVITDGSIANGANVTSAANGQVTAAVTGSLSFGRAVIGTDESAAAGDTITIIPCVPFKYAF